MRKDYLIKSVPILFALIMASNVFSQSTTGEYVNPFNNFMRTDEWVDLFSGNAAFTHPLYTLRGRAGMDIDIQLRYSSNVYTNARARNEKPTSEWVGLGWALGFGSIYCDHNGTMTYTDDFFWWVSPVGVIQRILFKNGKFYLEREPFWKVEPDFFNVTIGAAPVATIIRGWTLTSTEGKKYRYGDYNGTAFEYSGTTRGLRAATRYEFCWYGSKHVGCGSAGTSKLYPYRWDLSEIADPNGNAITFLYEQVKEPLKSGTLEYTKASYLYSIKNPEGAHIEFRRKAKIADEWYDRYTYENEADGFMEKFETDLLDNVIAYGANNEVLRKFIFTYSKLNPYNLTNAPTPADYYTKSLLTEIREENGDALSSKVLTKASFTYNTDITQFNTLNYHYGAMSGYASPSGATVQYTYKKQMIQLPTTARGTMPDWTICKWDATGGELSDGTQYFVTTPYRPSWPSGPDADKTKQINIYNWDGGRWIKHDYFPDLYGNTYPYCVVAGVDFFVMYIPGTPLNRDDDKPIYVFNWDGKRWVRTLSTLINIKDKMTIVCGRNSFIITGSNPYPDPHAVYTPLVYAYNWNGVSWGLSSSLNGTDLGQRFDMKQATIKGNFLTILSSSIMSPYNHNKTFVYRWDGSDWVDDGSRCADLQKLNSDYDYSFYYHSMASIGDNFFALHVDDINSNPLTTYRYPRQYIYAFNWDGTNWVKTGDRLEGNIPCGGSNYFVTTPHLHSISPYEARSNIYTWNGSNWIQRALYNIGYPNLGGDAVENMVNTIHTADAFFIGSFYPCFLPRNRTDIPIPPGWTWPTELIAPSQNFLFNTIAYTGDNFYGLCQWSYDYPGSFWELPQYFYFKAGVWDGKQWKEITDLPVTPPSDFRIGAMFTTSTTLGVLTQSGECKLYYKAQDQLGATIASYVVNQKIVNNGTGSVPIVITYNFLGTEPDSPDSANFDTRYGTAKYNRVQVRTQNNGYTEYRFFNDTRADNQDARATSNVATTLAYRELDGWIYNVKQFKQDGSTIVSQELLDYIAYNNTSNWHAAIYYPRMKSREISVQNVKRIEKNYYNDINGLPYIVSTTKNDGKQRLVKTTFAFEKTQYSGMGVTGAYLLAQPCQSVVYEKNAGDNTSEPLLSEIRSAEVTTYSNTFGCTSWMPYQSHVWKADMDADGIPKTAYIDFDFANPSGNTTWKLINTAVKYDKYGYLLVNQKPTVGPVTTSYRNDYSLPMGTIANCHFEGAGVFTGDYNTGEYPNYWDHANGWAKGSAKENDNVTYRARLSNDPANAHYGQKSIYVNTDYAACRVSKLDAGRAYIMSAWVKVTSGTLTMATDYRYTNATYTWPVEGATLVTRFGSVSTTITAAQCAGQWKNINVIIPASKTTELYNDPSYTGKIWFAQAWIGGDPAGPTFTAYIDDIRFYPLDALAATNYYDAKWLQPIIAINANNNPGKKVIYDEFGRPVELRKIDKSKPAISSLLMKESYNLMTGK